MGAKGHGKQTGSSIPVGGAHKELQKLWSWGKATVCGPVGTFQDLSPDRGVTCLKVAQRAKLRKDQNEIERIWEGRLEATSQTH